MEASGSPTFRLPTLDVLSRRSPDLESGFEGVFRSFPE
jgi:hypothetical protein